MVQDQHHLIIGQKSQENYQYYRSVGGTLQLSPKKVKKSLYYYRGVLSRKIDFREGGGGTLSYLPKKSRNPLHHRGVLRRRSTKSARYYRHNLSEKSTCLEGTVVIGQESRKILYTTGAFYEEKSTFGEGGGGRWGITLICLIKLEKVLDIIGTT